MKKIGWGILGPGSIARRFINDLLYCENVNLVAVGSRSLEKAKSIAKEFDFQRAYGSYEELVKDKDVDVIYIATPHPFHFKQAMLCMNAGKAVLCEKPITVNAIQIEELVECAKVNDVFFMEAMKSRFFPVNIAIKEIINSGRIGKPTLIKADCCSGKWTDGDVTHINNRLTSMELAGGSLLDMGVYCVYYATYMKGKTPTQIKAMSTKVETGADGLTTMLLKYDDGTMAMLTTSIVQATKDCATIYCEKGRIEVERYKTPTRAVVIYNDNRVDEIIHEDMLQDGRTGFEYEAEHVMECLDAGLIESPCMTWQNSIDVMEILDEVREQIDLVFPFE